MNTHSITRLTLAFIAAILLISLPATAGKDDSADVFKGRVVRVIDGNSLVVERPAGGKAQRIELAGIEIVERTGAAKLLGDLVLHKEIEVRIVRRQVDPHARVFLDGTNVANALVEAGVARRDDLSLRPVRRLRGLGRLTQTIFGGGRSGR